MEIWRQDLSFVDFENMKFCAEEKAEDTKEGEMTTAAQSPVVSRRDIATQMSPEETSPNNNNQSPPLVVSVIEPPPREVVCRGGEVREVKMDKGARMIKRPKRRVMSSSSRVIRREQPEVEDNSEASASSSSWDISEPAMTLSK